MVEAACAKSFCARWKDQLGPDRSATHRDQPIGACSIQKAPERAAHHREIAAHRRLSMRRLPRKHLRRNSSASLALRNVQLSGKLAFWWRRASTYLHCARHFESLPLRALGSQDAVCGWRAAMTVSWSNWAAPNGKRKASGFAIGTGTRVIFVPLETIRPKNKGRRGRRGCFFLAWMGPSGVSPLPCSLARKTAQAGKLRWRIPGGRNEIWQVA